MPMLGRMTMRITLLGCLLSSSLLAQGSAVVGTVFDSVVRAPLIGAVVQIVRVDSATSSKVPHAAERVFTAVTDTIGQYRVAGLPLGQFIIGFQHEALSALGLESPLRAFQIRTDTTFVIDLAIPAGASIHAAKCTLAAPGDGVVAGFVLDAARGSALSGTTVTLGWVEMAVVEKQFRAMPKRVIATATDEGTYLACGVPGGTPVTIEAVKAGFRPVFGEVSIPEGGTLRRDFLLVDTTVVARTHTVLGRVLFSDGTRVSGGHVSIAALEVDVDIANGVFAIPGVPAGTWLIEARMIGYEPTSLLVDVGLERTTPITLELGQKVQLLDEAKVVAKMGRDERTLRDIAERRRMSAGTQFFPGSSWMQSALQQSDVLRAARGFSWIGPDSVIARGCRDFSGRKLRLVVYLDGQRYPGGLGMLKNDVTMSDVLAMEAYPDFMGIPPMWRTNDACAVVAVWTKH
ncbi:MAG: carboxypeptidase-like regulatory domain-containing protein [Gemmatimonadaceae bacterium]